MGYKIAIDGTAGSGKSTICKLIAKNFGFNFISTGGFYRAVAFILKEKNLVDANQEAIIKELSNHQIEIKADLFFVDSKNITALLKTETISLIASNLATRTYIRDYVNQILIKLVNHCPKVLMDGRGIAEEIMPDANLKFYFYSSLLTRVKRRKKELALLNKKVNYPLVYIGLLKRDWRDKHRKLAPSKITPNTIKINTSNKTIDAVFNEVKKYIKV